MSDNFFDISETFNKTKTIQMRQDIIDKFIKKIQVFFKFKVINLKNKLKILLFKIKEDVSSYISKEIKIEDVSERNETHLLEWMGKINETMKDLYILTTSFSYHESFFENYRINYAKIASIAISNSVN